MAEAKKNGWMVISMKSDWKRIFQFQPWIANYVLPVCAGGQIFPLQQRADTKNALVRTPH